MRFHIGVAFCVLFCIGCTSSSTSIFRKPSAAVVVTQGVVVNKGLPILAAFHYADGDQWVFLTDVNPVLDVQVSVTLEDLLKMDESLRELSDLPPGWKAIRETKGGLWKRQKIM